MHTLVSVWSRLLTNDPPWTFRSKSHAVLPTLLEGVQRGRRSPKANGLPICTSSIICIFMLLAQTIANGSLAMAKHFSHGTSVKVLTILSIENSSTIHGSRARVRKCWVVVRATLGSRGIIVDASALFCFLPTRLISYHR